MQTKIFLLILLVIVFVIFVLQNAGAASLKFLFWQVTMSMVLWIIFSFVLGFLAAELLSRIRQRKRTP
ncbi:MAG: LapA family protein [candidate division Zixibacteria bacterium]|nr:LapA family protein [candidate division Zixibacteria bacterium]